MKEKVIKVASMGDYYVIEELDYQSKKYILCFRIDEEEINEKIIKLSLFEVNITNNDLTINNVDDETAQIVTKIIMEKIKQVN